MKSGSTAFDRYIKDISIHPRITKEREIVLSRIISENRSEEHVEAAIDELVRANLRLVVHCVKSFSSFINSNSTSVTAMDLIAEGNLALVKAAQNFNPSYQTDEHTEPIRFSAYACKCIKNAMRKTFRKARFIHIPDHHFAYWKKIKDLNEGEQEDASDSTLKEKLEITDSRLGTIKQGLKVGTVMLEDLVVDEGSSCWSDFIINEKASDPRCETDRSDLRNFLIKQMETLPPRTSEMLALMFLNEHKPTLQDLSLRFGVSKERCRQVCARGIQLLRQKMQSTWDQVEHVEIFSKLAAESAADHEKEVVMFPPAQENLSVA